MSNAFRRMQTPHLAVTGRPETPAMGVNAIDELGRKAHSVIRSQTGQLYIMAGDSVPVRLPEDVFARTVAFWYEKYSNKPQ